MTSITTLLVLLALFFLGGEVIHSFALALLIGVVVGTYQLFKQQPNKRLIA
jgi:preprotein translocase subunit SecF